MERSSSLQHATIPVPLRVVEAQVADRDRVEQLIRRLQELDAACAAGAEEHRHRAWLDAVTNAEKRGRTLEVAIEQVRSDLRAVHADLRASPVADDARTGARPLRALLGVDLVLRYSVLTLLAALLCLMVWAGVLDYSLRVTSDTPTFIALVTGMAERPFAEQSPFLAQQIATQHATPYIQAVAFVWSFLDGDTRNPVEVGRLLALVGIPVFALLLYSVFLYVRRLAGSRAAWLSLPVLLGLFGPPHVIWASDHTLHGALYASYFPQNLALALLLLTLFALSRDGYGSLALACLGAAGTMLVHPFSGVLLCVLATTESCYAAYRKDSGYFRPPLALGAGFVLGTTWPAYSLDRAFAETGLRGVFFVSLCICIPFVVRGLAMIELPTLRSPPVGRWIDALAAGSATFKLAVIGAIGAATITVWELALVRSPPEESERLAVYWVDGRWRWPLLLLAGTVGLSGLARLARHGHIVPAVWFAGCLGLGLLGAASVPVPVWYRFLLLCQIPLAIGVAAVIAYAGRTRTLAIVLATFTLTIGVKVVTLLESPPTMSYFGTQPQAVWELGDHVPPGPGLVATDPSTAYFIPAATGRRVLTVGKGHVSSKRELALARRGYRLLRRYYAGGGDWWQAAQEMWRRGVRYVIVEKHTTLEPRTLDDFIWQTGLLRTQAQRRALGNYFYENGRVGNLVFDSPEYAIYRLDRTKLFGQPGRRLLH